MKVKTRVIIFLHTKIIAAIVLISTCKLAHTSQKEAKQTDSSQTNDEKRLVDYLMRTYDNSIRPVKNANDAVVIRLGITLTQIFDLDEKNQVLTTNVWLDQEWIDEFLTWNSTHFGNLNKIRIPCEKIWRPDIVLYNSADDYTRGYMNSRAIIEPNGNVFWPPPTKFRSTCGVDVTYFPFDDQKCNLKFGSWIYDGLQVDVVNRSSEVDMTNYVKNNEWDLLETKLTRNIIYYPCCHEPFPDVTITVIIRRKFLYYTYNVILPCMMLSILTLLVFCIPPDSGEKIALGVTVLLAYSVFSSAISEKLPETSESTPLLGIYLTAVMAITSISVVMTVIVLNFHYRGPNDKEMPLWLKKCLKSKKLATSSHLSYFNKKEQLAELCGVKVEKVFKTNNNLNRMHRFAVSSESLIDSCGEPPLNEFGLTEIHRTKSCNRLNNGESVWRANNGYNKYNHNFIINTNKEILKACKYLLWKSELKDCHSAISQEWRLLALFIDKVLFWIFFMIIFVSSLVLLVVIPIRQRGFPEFN